MKILIRRGMGVGGSLDGPPRCDSDKLFIYVAEPKSDVAHGFEIDFDRIKNLKPGEAIKG